MLPMGTQIVWLFVLAIPVACISWTVTHEEIFREPREYCVNCSKNAQSIWKRKFFYLFTCEYCFSHYISAFFVAFTQYQLLLDDWRGYLLAAFALVWIANIYMSIYNLIRQDTKTVKLEAQKKEAELKK